MVNAYQAVMAATFFLMLVWVYFYSLDRERYLGFWIISMAIFFGRLVLFDYGPYAWRQSLLGFTIFQLSFFICALIFIWGIQIFMDKPLTKYWLYAAAGTFLISFIFTLFRLPMIYKLLPPAFFATIILIYIGIVFVCDLPIKGLGNYITGYSFILWGFLTLYMPYSISVPWLSQWAHLAASYLRLFIALGIILVYFEKTRVDLANKEIQYRLLAENAVDVIYRYRLLPEAKVEYISPSILPTTGYTPEEYYADTNLFTSRIHPDDFALFSDIIEKPSLPGDLPLTFRLIRKDGKTIWIEQKYVPIYDKNGNLVSLEGILRDVSARKNLEQLVTRADKMNTVGQMAVSVAHEIRNPLTAVRGYLQIMNNKEENTIRKERYALMINELDRTNAIITEYLLLAQDKVPNLKRCNLNNHIITLLPLIQATAGASKSHIKLDLEDIPELYLDNNEMRQLLFNLANNALDAMPAGGEVVIHTFLDQDKVVLAISDQGSGIPPHILDNLGTPFLTTKDTGTGLGLPVCYQIAARHNAVIHVDTCGQGTTFSVHFDLPAAVAI